MKCVSCNEVFKKSFNPLLCNRCSNIICKSCYTSQSFEFKECEDCINNFMYINKKIMKNPNNEVKKYNFKPSAVFFPSFLWDYNYTGVELEVPGARPKLIRAYYELPSNFRDMLYMKEDGSIYGVEFVTHPCSIQEQGRLWEKFLPIINKYANTKLYYVASPCGEAMYYGLHIHLSKSLFTPNQQIKLLTFFYKAEPFLKKNSGRSLDAWMRNCAMFPSQIKEIGFNSGYVDDIENLVCNKCKNDDCFGECDNLLNILNDANRIVDRKLCGLKLSEKFCKSLLQHDKHFACNVYTNANTIEIRIFASTLHYETLMGRVILAMAIGDFSRSIASKFIGRWGKTETVNAFKNFINSKDRYCLAQDLIKEK